MYEIQEKFVSCGIAYRYLSLSILFSSYVDDIDLEDHKEIRKEQSILGALNKKKLAGKFQALKGL